MRVQRIDQAIQSDGIVPLEGLLRATGSSIPTLRRDLKYMRGKLGFPIVYSRKNNGYRYGSESGGEPVRVPAEAVLPHLWFSPSELPVLLADCSRAVPFLALPRRRHGLNSPGFI